MIKLILKGHFYIPSKTYVRIRSVRNNWVIFQAMRAGDHCSIVVWGSGEHPRSDKNVKNSIRLITPSLSVN